jgi:hypothetical protein
MRNAARRKAMAEGKVKKGDGKDVHHTTAISKGGTNSSKLVAVPAETNRSFARGAKNQLVSETSPRERKKNANSR